MRSGRTTILALALYSLRCVSCALRTPTVLAALLTALRGVHIHLPPFLPALPVQWVSDAELRCTVPAGLGAHRRVVVTVGNQSSNYVGPVDNSSTLCPSCLFR